MEQTATKKYRTILADPPWDINQRSKNSSRSAERYYELMPLEHIKVQTLLSPPSKSPSATACLSG